MSVRNAGESAAAASPELTVVFRTQSDIEANVVRGLLETRGIRTLLSSAAPHAVFPLSVDGLGEFRTPATATVSKTSHRLNNFPGL